MSFCRGNFSATALSGNMALNEPDKPSQERKEKDNTFFKGHLISASVSESYMTYESSVDILLELSNVWIGRQGWGGWDLQIGVNKILEVWEYKAKRSQYFFPEAWLFNACFPIFGSSILFLGIGQAGQFTAVLLSPRMSQIKFWHL